MKITKIRTLTVAAPPHRNWVFVKVETDQPGLYGWGEGTLEWKTRGVVGTVEDFVPILLGQDPRDVTRIVELLQRTSFWPLFNQKVAPSHGRQTRLLASASQTSVPFGPVPRAMSLR